MKDNITVKNEVLWKDRKHFMWFPIDFEVYKLDSNKLYIERGLFTTSFDETLLYRITDIKLKRTLFQKLFGTGTIEICAKADHDQHIILDDIADPMKVKELLSELVEESRNKHGIIGKEFYGGTSEE